jgi:hypothetical protein
MESGSWMTKGNTYGGQSVLKKDERREARCIFSAHDPDAELQGRHGDDMTQSWG